METSVYFERMRQVREAMGREGVDLFLAGPSSNLFYLTGCALGGDERLLLLVFPAGDRPFILANLLYRAEVQVLPVEDLVFWEDGEDPFAVLRRELASRSLAPKKIALEGKLPALFTLPLADCFPGGTMVGGSPLTAPLRGRKDPAELDLIRRASREADRALEAVIGRGNYWLGKTEAAFFDELNAELRRGGLDSVDAVVAVGANGAVPHHRTGHTVIEGGKGLIVDFWGRLEGYYTDCTRTFHFGKPDREFETVHAVVLEAHLAAEERARPGNALGEVDAAARAVIEKYGYGEYFTHRTGHGLGIDPHEGLSAARGEQGLIEPGMVFSIEPGIYLPGRLGVRIENLVAINREGPEVLHAFPRQLRVIS